MKISALKSLLTLLVWSTALSATPSSIVPITSYLLDSSNNTTDLKRWQWDGNVEYVGGFRVTYEKVGSGSDGWMATSKGAFTIDESKNTLYTIARDFGFGELNIPELVKSEDPHNFNQANIIHQRFERVYKNPDRPERDVTGIGDYFRVTGMSLINNQLVVNYIDWYNGNGDENDTTMIFKDASDLNNSQLIGPFQLQGRAHAAGWTTPIPKVWQNRLGGTHVSGTSQGSINSRLSIGPSAFIWRPQEQLLNATQGGSITTTVALDYPLSDWHMLYDTSVYNPNEIGEHDFDNDFDYVLYNGDENNNLWTVASEAIYGVIIPETSTYLIVGSSAGHEFGLMYKGIQDNGHECGGQCSKIAADNYNYYWLYDVNDLVLVVEGKMNPWDVRPYAKGKIDTFGYADKNGNINKMGGAYYDADDDLLYISIKDADTVPTYEKPPVYLVYHLHPKR